MAFFLPGNIQPNTPFFFGLGVASGAVSGLAVAPGAGAALLAVDAAASFGPLFTSTGLLALSAFFPAAAAGSSEVLTVGDASWAQTSAAQALIATTVGRMERGFGMVRKNVSGGLCRLGRILSSASTIWPGVCQAALDSRSIPHLNHRAQSRAP